MIENEFKLMLTEQQYNAICARYEWDKTISQTNHYYDTDDFALSDKHITVRVRTIAEECFLQMKLPNGAEYSRIELEQRLGSTVPEVISADMLSALAGEYLTEPLPAVKRLGALTTERRVKEFDGAELDLDKSTYFGKTDFELEIEFTDEAAAKRLLHEIIQAAGITDPRAVCVGKIRRFLSEYRKQQGE